MKKFIIILILSILILTSPFYLSASGILPYTKLWCTVESIDINSGKIKIEKYGYYYKYEENIHSNIVADNIVISNNQNPLWKTVNIFSPGFQYSPHFKYHGAINQINTIKLTSEMVKLNQHEISQICNLVLESWKRDGSYHKANKIINEYFSSHIDKMKSAQQVDAPEPATMISPASQHLIGRPGDL